MSNLPHNPNSPQTDRRPPPGYVEMLSHLLAKSSR